MENLWMTWIRDICSFFSMEKPMNGIGDAIFSGNTV